MRREPGEIDAKVHQTEHVPESPFLPTRHARRKRLRVVGWLRSRRSVNRKDRNRGCGCRHRLLVTEVWVGGRRDAALTSRANQIAVAR
jgi:hypothetical protein